MASVFLYAEVSHFYTGNLDFDMIRALCGSQQTAIEEADYLFSHSPLIEQLERVKIGSAENPEMSATIIYDLSDEQRIMSNTILTGPGILNTKEMPLPLSQEFILRLMEINENFPFGVDLFLIYPDHNLVGLPRTTKIEVAL